jgi:hypothetical protein
VDYFWTSLASSAVLRAEDQQAQAVDPGGLFTLLVIEPGRVLACPEAWSNWRRGHQYRARTSYYQRQEAALA